MLKSYLLLNDTRSELHWGCYGVSSIIEGIASDKGVWLDSITTAEIKSLSQDALLNKVMNYSKKFPNLTVIVNGEGSLHQKNIEGEKIIGLLDELSGVEFEIWNASLYSLPIRWEVVFAKSKRTVVRDRRSYNVAAKVPNLKYCPDLLFKFCMTNKIKKISLPLTVITDSVLLNHEGVASRLANSDGPLLGVDIRFNFFVLLKKITLRLLMTLVRYDFLGLLRPLYRSLFKRNLSFFNGVGVYVGKTTYVGRYHYAVMCLSLGEGFFVLGTNSLKISSLINDIVVEENGISGAYLEEVGYCKIESIDIFKFKKYLNLKIQQAYYA